MIKAYLRYLLRARDEHALHSPFLFQLYTEVIRPAVRPPTLHGGNTGSIPVSVTAMFQDIAVLRRALLRSNEQITVTDYGAGPRSAGSRKKNGPQRSVSDMARHAAKPARYARLLYRLAQRFVQPGGLVIELGTSLGLTTSHLARAVADIGVQVVTFEGCPETARLARETFAKLNVANVDIVVGNIDATLPDYVAQQQSADLIFFDANHRYEPTLRYFTTCLPLAHNDSLFIFDDIHWSAEMERAWGEIQQHPAVSVTIDLFGVGLVFFRREQPKERFVLKL